MANALYDKGRQSFLEATIAYLTDTIKAVLVQTGVGHYVVNLAADQFLSSIVAGDRIAISPAFTTKTSVAGVADADDVTWAAVAAGPAAGAIVIYKDTGNPATSPLIAYIDTDTGLPVTPSGGDIIQVWDNGANKIFKL
jgi:hypothetical protein